MKFVYYIFNMLKILRKKNGEKNEIGDEMEDEEIRIRTKKIRSRKDRERDAKRRKKRQDMEKITKKDKKRKKR